MENIKKYPITSLIIGICIIVYIFQVINYGFNLNSYNAMNMGGYNPVLVSLGDYYRLITANFIHFDILHIVLNLYSFFNLSIFLESFFNKKSYSLILIFTMLLTTLIPYIFYLLFDFEANVISGGLSGVVFGLLGSLGALAFVLKNEFEKIFKSLLKNIVIMLIISLLPGISFSAHVSGLVGGFIVTFIILKYKEKQI